MLSDELSSKRNVFDTKYGTIKVFYKRYLNSNISRKILLTTKKSPHSKFTHTKKHAQITNYNEEYMYYILILFKKSIVRLAAIITLT